MNNVDLDEPTSFLDHVFLGCTQRECKPNEIIIEQYKEKFESRVSAGAIVKITRVGKNLTQRRLRGPTTCKDMLKSALRDIANWQMGRLSSCTKLQLLAWTTIISKRKNWKRLENCPKKTHILF